MKFLHAIGLMMALCIIATGNAEASKIGELAQEIKNLKWEDGRLRIEGQGWAGTRSGRRSRSGDTAVSAVIEKEFALGKKLAVGVRAIPLFYYDEHRTDEEIWGAGGGVTLRYYTAESQDGWFVEYSESLIAHSDKFRGNSGSINFMSEVGVGYEFNNNWHIAAKWRHLSNAGIANRNSGINGVGIGIGFSF